MIHFRVLIFTLLFAAVTCSTHARIEYEWGVPFCLPEINEKQNPGVARPFYGFSNGMVLFAGGGNFPDKPLLEGGKKQFHSEIYRCDPARENPKWERAGHLPLPMGEGAAVTTPRGIVCVGGAVGKYGDSVTNSCFLMNWDPAEHRVTFTPLPPLPHPARMPGLAAHGHLIYAVILDTVWKLDLDNESAGWKEDRRLPFQTEQPVAVFQCGELFVFPGYDPTTRQSQSDLPGERTMIGATGIASGDQHILLFGGSNRTLWNAGTRPGATNDFHFGRPILVYHTVTKQWFELPDHAPHPIHPLARCGAAVVALPDGRILVSGGETQPGIRTPSTAIGSPIRTRTLSPIDLAVICVYLLLMIGVGLFFMRRNKNADDYFRAGGRIPWWVVSMSIYATMFSSITFLSLPAMSYLTDCRYFVISFGIILLAPIVTRYYLPFFRKLNVTSAYEYLEKRFNLPCRLFASAAFTLFMIARSAIVTYLPAIAIAAVTEIDINTAILAVTLITILYCTIGGIEAVIWSDFLQSIVLIVSTIVIVLFLILGTEGGFSGFLTLGNAAEKFRIFDFSLDWTKPVFWVVLIGGIVANLASYTSDQCVVQRYMTTKNEKEAAKSILFNGCASFLNAFLFFIIGVALWTFYRSNPELLDVTMPKNDSVFPIFIGSALPAGVSGLVLAALAAATMSTISSNLNSAATAITTDFYERLAPQSTRSDTGKLLCGKIATIVTGLLGGGFALILANMEVFSIYDQFQRFLGILTGGLGCLFFMGRFMKKVNGTGATVGLIINYLVCIGLDQLPLAGKPHLLLYGALGMIACLIVAPIVSHFSERNCTK